MKKKHLTMILSVVVLTCLIGVYFYLQGRDNSVLVEPAATSTPTQYYYLIEREKDELVSFSIENLRETLTFTQKEDENGSDSMVWVIEEYSDAKLATYTINSLVSSAYSLSTDMKLSDSPTNLKEYGLDPPSVTFTSKFVDGTEKVVYLGSTTPMQDYYYAMTDGDPALYMVYKYTGDRFFNGIGELMDTTLPKIDTAALTYSYIREEGKPEIELDYSGTEEQKKSDIASYGAVVLTMFKPYAGREVYVTNLEEFVLKDISSIYASELIEYSPADLSKYGLDNPKLELHVKDTVNELHILVGDETEDGFNYCKLADQNYVFTVKSDTFSKCYNISIFRFIERFVSLVNIVDVERIEIISENANYDITLTHTTDEEDNNLVIPSINGQVVQELAFKTFYASLIGLSYDTEIPLYTPEKEPDVTVRYHQNNGQPPVEAKFYSYNTNFYAAQRDDFDIQFVASKQGMNIMFNNMIKLLAGELDRDY